LKVFNGLRDQGQRELIFDGGPQVLKRHKLPVDGIAPVAHGVSPHLCGNPTNVGSFLFPFILLRGHWRSNQSAIRLCSNAMRSGSVRVSGTAAIAAWCGKAV